jgi:anaerobic selenocysteine-containing dehydrogenase
MRPRHIILKKGLIMSTSVTAPDISIFDLSTPPSEQGEPQVIPGLCGICPAGCGVKISMEDGRIQRIAPWKGHPQGICCPRGAHAPEIVYSRDRLLYPLKRVGPRGAGQFVRASWDEALDTIAHQFKRVARQYGPQAVCTYTGRGTFERSLCDLLTPAGVPESSAWNLLFPFGSPNTTGVGAICYVAHGVIAPVTTFGVWDVDTFADIEHSDLVVVWGDNPATDSSPINLNRIRAAQKRGAEVIVIDHRRSKTVRANSLCLFLLISVS